MNPFNRNIKNLTVCLFGLLSLLAPLTKTYAHAANETYVWFNVEENNFSGRVEINLNDLREKLFIPLPKGGDSRLPMLQKNAQKVQRYIRKHFEIEIDGQIIPVTFTSTDLLDLPEKEGSYAQYLYSTAKGTVSNKVTISNTLFVEDNFIHRSLLCIERNRKTGKTYKGEFTALVFSADNPRQELDLTNINVLLRPRDFIWQGVLHLWTGFDHILFIILLLLPAVLIYDNKTWQPAPQFKIAIGNIFRIVTLFTIAHSITLSLAALGLVRLPSQLVEPVIALTIILVAMNTIFPKFRDKAWLLIFIFGLIHGLGFASVMSALPFRMVHLAKVLIGFNVGVELGQLAIVAFVFPIIFLLRKSKIYTPVFLKGGSFIAAIIALYWLVERLYLG